MWKCRLLGIYYTLRYGRDMLRRGQVLLGHEFEFNGEVCGDHWHMECTRCGVIGASDTGPKSVDNYDN